MKAAFGSPNSYFKNLIVTISYLWKHNELKQRTSIAVKKFTSVVVKAQ